MKPRFEPDTEAVQATSPPGRLIDPEAYDATEQQFAASLEETPRPKFVVEKATPAAAVGALSILEADSPEAEEQGETPAPDPTPRVDALQETVQSDLLQLQDPQVSDPEAWRQEVAARVNNYRSRKRTRGPRYPSLKLAFEPPEPSWNTTTEAPAQAITTRQAVALQRQEQRLATAPEMNPTPAFVAEETTARIIEFPRSANAPPRPLDELADPVIDSPRILEAPELAPPPPALGGILMDPVETEVNEKRPGFEMPLQSAPMSRRMAAAAADATLVLAAFAAFAYIFFRITAVVPPWPMALGTALGLLGTFWAAYQYLLLVYTGTTPGLKLAKLQLSRFDGSPAPRRIRRWRVLVSVLSGLSLGLGYAWCFLDEDELCWHDRITRTYMAPRKQPDISPISPVVNPQPRSC